MVEGVEEGNEDSRRLRFKNGKHRKMAKAVAKGAQEKDAFKVMIKRAELISNGDLLNADGIIIGQIVMIFGRVWDAARTIDAASWG